MGCGTSRRDDEIYAHFRRVFPGMNVAQLSEEKDLKSDGAKLLWRNFCADYSKGDIAVCAALAVSIQCR